MGSRTILLRRPVPAARGAARPRAVISGRIEATALTGEQARGDESLLSFPCGARARTSGAVRAVEEVREALDQAYEGLLKRSRIVKVHEDGGGLVGVAVVCLVGDSSPRPLTREPYIEAIARHDDYHGHVLADGRTSAGAVVLRAVLDAVAVEYGGRPAPELWARVLPGNATSQRIFDELGFERVPKDAFRPPTEQQVRVRRATAPPPPALSPEIYVRPQAVARLSAHAGRNHPCWCGSGAKLKLCHGF